MTLEDILRMQRNHAMDAAAHAAVLIEQLKAELASTKAEISPEAQAESQFVPRQAAKIADPG